MGNIDSHFIIPFTVGGFISIVAIAILIRSLFVNIRRRKVLQRDESGLGERTNSRSTLIWNNSPPVRW